MNKLPRASEELLSFDRIYGELHKAFGRIEDHRRNNSSYSLQDILSGAFAMFSLKSPPLLNLSLRSQQEDKNLLEVYRIHKLCSDTQMRQVLDKLPASKVRALLSKVMGKVKRSAFFDSYRYYKQMVVVSIDGVEHFSSQLDFSIYLLCRSEGGHAVTLHALEDRFIAIWLDGINHRVDQVLTFHSTDRLRLFPERISLTGFWE